MTLTDSNFVGNSAGVHAGAIYTLGGTLNLQVSSGKTSLFSGNSAAGQASSIGLDAWLLKTRMNAIVEDGATLDMRDPMGVYNDDATRHGNKFGITIAKSGSGNWKLGGANEFGAIDSGSTTFDVSDGTLYLYGAGEVDNSITDVNGKVTTAAAVSAGNLKLDGVDSRFTLGSTATLVAAGQNAIVTDGILALQDGATIRGGTAADASKDSLTATGGRTSLTLKAQGGSTLSGKLNVGAVTSMDVLTLDAAMADATPGSGSLIKFGAGTVVLVGDSTYTGGTTVSDGILQVGDGGTTGSILGDAQLAEGTTLAFARSNRLMFNGDISGDGKLVQQGLGSLVLTGNATHTNGTSINSGVLQVGDGGTSGNLKGDVQVADGASLVFDRSDNISSNGVISGAGRLIQQGSGKLTLTGTNTYAGGTTIRSGILEGHAANFGSGAIRNDGALLLVQDSNADFANALSGTGSLTKLGSGRLNLTGDGSALTGLTTIRAGTLAVNGSLGGDVSVDATGTLAGAGKIGGNVLVKGTLSPGNSPGTLNIGGDLALAQTATTVFELGNAGAIGGSGNDWVKVGGNLTLGGALDARVASAGYYRLFDYGGALTGAFDSESVTSSLQSFTVADAQVQTRIPGQVNLRVRNAGQTLAFWDGADHTGNGTVDGGNGTWSSTGTNWTAEPGKAEINGHWGALWASSWAQQGASPSRVARRSTPCSSSPMATSSMAGAYCSLRPAVTSQPSMSTVAGAPLSARSWQAWAP
ncbi:autotransporter-associated beta strand repeat-containing protein [Pseudomonas chlororaphis subsp. piscium]|nr:autotransporter-associated beta strand repeat-containing protein [Pseudomonas chlororaphis subsp. piscium]